MLYLFGVLIHLVFSLSTALCVPLLLLAQVSDSTSSTYKYYSNDAGSLQNTVSPEARGQCGSQVAEVDADTRNCHVFLDEDAHWFTMTRKEEITVLSKSRFEILQDKCKHIALETHDTFTTSEKPQTQDEPHGRSLGRSEGEDSVIIEADENGASQNTSEEAIDLSMFGLEDAADVNATMFGTSSGFPLIFVGTKWCGAGDVARSIDDLGTFDDTDKCCREHDHCPDSIPAKECKHDLCNDGDYTRSHCSCDDKFLRCLKDDKGPSKVASFKIAHVYFNLLRPKCFDLRHPTKECKKHRITGECIQHTYDYEQPTTWQYFAAQPYTPVIRTITKILDLDPLKIPTNIGRVVPTLPSLPTVPSLRFPLDSIGSSRGNTGEN